MRVLVVWNDWVNEEVVYKTDTKEHPEDYI